MYTFVKYLSLYCKITLKNFLPTRHKNKSFFPLFHVTLSQLESEVSQLESEVPICVRVYPKK